MLICVRNTCFISFISSCFIHYFLLSSSFIDIYIFFECDKVRFMKCLSVFVKSQAFSDFLYEKPDCFQTIQRQNYTNTHILRVNESNSTSWIICVCVCKRMAWHLFLGEKNAFWTKPKEKIQNCCTVVTIFIGKIFDKRNCNDILNRCQALRFNALLLFGSSSLEFLHLEYVCLVGFSSVCSWFFLARKSYPLLQKCRCLSSQKITTMPSEIAYGDVVHSFYSVLFRCRFPFLS